MGTYCLVYGSYCPLFRGGLSCCSLPFFILCIYYIIRFFVCQQFFLRFLKFSEGFRPYPLASAPCPVLLSLSYVFIIAEVFLFVNTFFIFLIKIFSAWGRTTFTPNPITYHRSEIERENRIERYYRFT